MKTYVTECVHYGFRVRGETPYGPQGITCPACQGMFVPLWRRSTLWKCTAVFIVIGGFILCYAIWANRFNDITEAYGGVERDVKLPPLVDVNRQ